jgi:hypothetical protein
VSTFALKIERRGPYSNKDVTVVDARTGADIPFVWLDDDTVAVDGALAEFAAIAFRPVLQRRAA